MKRRLIFTFTFFAVLAIFSFWNTKNGNSLRSDLLLNNIEALANPESASYACFGTGSIDCPITNTTVYGVIKLYRGGLDF